MFFPAPSAAATGSSITYISFAPASRAASMTARCSTSVIPDGTHIIIRGCPKRIARIFERKYFIISRVSVRFEITPSISGRTAWIFGGVLPSISTAAAPTALTSLVSVSTAITVGSFRTMPLFFIYTSIVAVPRSILISSENTIALSFHFLIHYHIIIHYFFG